MLIRAHKVHQLVDRKSARYSTFGGKIIGPIPGLLHTSRVSHIHTYQYAVL